MKLRKMLENMSGLIRIGADKGNSYFYIGTPEDFIETAEGKNPESTKPFLEREVVDQYFSEIEPATIIIVDGKEPGGYWYSGEGTGFYIKGVMQNPKKSRVGKDSENTLLKKKRAFDNLLKSVYPERYI